MRPSLERIGRFDEQRARQRLLDHLYLQPGHQGQGIGTAVMQQVLAEAGAAGTSLRVGALRGSDANRFYLRHGFVLVEEGEHDLYYTRPA